MYGYIKQQYGRDFAVGQTVYDKELKRFGEVIAPEGHEHYVHVRFDGDGDGRSLCHPLSVEATCKGPSTSGPRVDSDGRQLY